MTWMTWVLVAAIAFDASAWWLLKWATGQGDDFGAVFPGLLAIAIGVVLTLVYLAAVFWNHRFL